MTEYPHPAAPTDDEGHPIHPEQDHRICAGITSDRTTPTEHGRERDDIPYCTLAAGWGRDESVGPCRNHVAQGGFAGPDNPNADHLAFSEHFRSDLSDRETEAFDDIVDALADPDDALSIVREAAAEALLKYKRTGDNRFLQEFRRLADTFNLAPSEDQVDVSGDLDVSGLSPEEKEALGDLMDRDPQ